MLGKIRFFANTTHTTPSDSFKLMEQILENLKQSAQQLYAKLKDLYLSMTLGNRIVSTLLVATLLFSLCYLIAGSIQRAEPGSKTVRLYDGHAFDSNDKRAAENAFSKHGLQGHQWIGDQLQVPINKQSDYVAALADANVAAPTGRERLNTARNLGAWDPAKIMNERMMTSKEIDCAAAIKRIRGIADATVLSNKRPEWERNVWARTQITSVGVFVEAIDNKPLPAETIGAIGQIIKSSFGITNLKEISTVDNKNSRSYDGSGEEQTAGQSAYQRHQTRYQEEWNKRIYTHLPNIDGLNVETSVRLTTYREQKEFEVEHRKPTVLTAHELNLHINKQGWDRFFRPGQIAQWSRPLIDPTGNVSPQDLYDEKKRETEITNALPGVETKREELPFIPVAITVSIRIPREHVLQLWQQENRLFGDPEAKPTTEQIQAKQDELALSTKESVAKLLELYRPSNKTDPMELVTVTFYDPIRPEVPVLTAWEQFVLFLQQNWQTLGLMSLVFSGITVLWLISKPQKPDPIVIYEGLETPLEAIDARIAEQQRLEAERLAAEAAVAAAAAEEIEEFENTLGALGSLRSLRDEIAELIAQNPDAAAAVIRQWIGNAVLVEAKN